MTSDRNDLFDAVEKDLLRRFFGLKARLAKRELYGLDEDEEGASPDEEDDDPMLREAKRGVRLRLVKDHDYKDISLDDAVARICLHAIRARLPNWTAVTEKGFVSGRKPKPGRTAEVPLLPRYLFGIDWASSAPGMSWPEVYHATFIPGFKRWVVTASFDTDETCGTTDLAIDFFSARTDFDEGCRNAILYQWHSARGRGQEPWQDFLDGGTVSEKTALAWRDEVWPPRVDKVDEDGP